MKVVDATKGRHAAERRVLKKKVVMGEGMDTGEYREKSCLANMELGLNTLSSQDISFTFSLG